MRIRAAVFPSASQRTILARMPNALPSPCRGNGCANLTHKGYCEECEAKRQKGINARRGSSTVQGYGAHHRRWRKLVLARWPICVDCNTSPSTEADHVNPDPNYPQRWSLANGRGRCKPCHSRKTAQEDGGFGNRKAVSS